MNTYLFRYKYLTDFKIEIRIDAYSPEEAWKALNMFLHPTSKIDESPFFTITKLNNSDESTNR